VCFPEERFLNLSVVQELLGRAADGNLAALEHIAAVGDLQREASVLLDQQDTDTLLCIDLADDKVLKIRSLLSATSVELERVKAPMSRFSSWGALRTAGVRASLAGFGRLFDVPALERAEIPGLVLA
jgi:hypothetical protein